ncbi:MAG: cytochrome c [Rhodobacteraceae bacterium]|nr:cytochrome c [Alphaproteobacteria bacterium]MBT8476195.1 cytochrome c [Alphaproteobacteria bacterium]NNF71484.1 cytochrome c [Paracoccaceae bacterium]NNK68421.1 cytochrome c [Paracoccaceae bacterium]
MNIRHRTFPILLATLALATAALAHTGVKNPQVMARMENMSRIAEATKVLGQMVRGQTAFDAARVAEAARTLSEETRQIPAHFESQASDPKSEALPAIWVNWSDFEAKTRDGVLAANALSDVQTLEDLQAGLAALSKTCKSCHTLYRE